MARVITEPKDYEVWRSAIRGKIYIKRFDRKGDLINELVGPGRTIHIRPDERRLNQEMAASSKLDPFLNGFLVPVRLPDGSEDSEALASNPNTMSDDAMRELLADRRAIKKLKEVLATIDNAMTVQRFLKVAHEDDVDAGVKQIDALKERLSDLSGEDAYIEVETVITDGGREAFRTSAPESPAPENPSSGRRA